MIFFGWIAIATATVPSTYGTDPRSMGMAGGGVAISNDPGAALTNPAGLQGIRKSTFTVGSSAVLPSFKPVPAVWWDTNRDGSVDEFDSPLIVDANPDPTVGLHISIGRPLGAKVGVGANIYLPVNRLLRFRTIEPSLPIYPMYDNRSQRYAVAMGLAAEPLRGLRIGAGVDIIPTAKINLALNIDASLSGDASESTDDLVGGIAISLQGLDVDVKPGIAPIAGVQFHVGEYIKPLTGLWMGASYHHSISLPIHIDLDLQANIRASDLGDLEPLLAAIIVETRLGLVDHAVPMQVATGLGYKRGDWLVTYADFRWTRWSHLPINVAKLEAVDLTTPLVDLDDRIYDGHKIDAIFRDTWSIRAGGEVSSPKLALKNRFNYLRVSGRLGAQWEPAPLASQSPASALLDADRFAATVGVGLEAAEPMGWTRHAPIRLDLFFQAHVLGQGILARSAPEPIAGYPVVGAGIPVGGQLYVFGGSLGFDY